MKSQVLQSWRSGSPAATAVVWVQLGSADICAALLKPAHVLRRKTRHRIEGQRVGDSLAAAAHETLLTTWKASGGSGLATVPMR